MTKQEALEILKMLSAVESWSFATERMLPNYLHDQLSKAMDDLVRVVLQETAAETQKTN